MGIVEEQKKRDAKIIVSKSLAQKLYEKQLQDITNISHTAWFKQIIEYWERERDSAQIELNTVKEENLKIVQLRRQIAEDFVMFLNNLLKTKEVREKVKET